MDRRHVEPERLEARQAEAHDASRFHPEARAEFERDPLRISSGSEPKGSIGDRQLGFAVAKLDRERNLKRVARPQRMLGAGNRSDEAAALAA